MRPLIGVPGRRSHSAPILRFSATLAAEAICEAVYCAGGEPAILHGVAADPAESLAHRWERLDGLLAPGGADLGPARYGQEPDPTVEDVVDFQDEFDLAAVHAALAVGLPVLAVCRGMQVLNVALGGTLQQHLPAGEVGHRNGMHEVSVVAGSRLHDIVGAQRVDVSSYHHQAVDVLGRDLVVTATSDDGVVEAVEHTTADVVAVQWHPEDRHATSATDAALFADLVERAHKRMVRR